MFHTPRKDGSIVKRYLRSAVAVTLALATVVVGFTTRDGSWMLILGITSIMLLIWPVIPWVSAPDPRQYEDGLTSVESVMETSSE